MVLFRRCVLRAFGDDTFVWECPEYRVANNQHIDLNQETIIFNPILVINNHIKKYIKKKNLYLILHIL